MSKFSFLLTAEHCISFSTHIDSFLMDLEHTDENLFYQVRYISFFFVLDIKHVWGVQDVVETTWALISALEPASHIRSPLRSTGTGRPCTSFFPPFGKDVVLGTLRIWNHKLGYLLKFKFLTMFCTFPCIRLSCLSGLPFSISCVCCCKQSWHRTRGFWCRLQGKANWWVRSGCKRQRFV